MKEAFKMKKFIILGISLSIFLLPILSYADSYILSPADFLPNNEQTDYYAGLDYLNVKTTSTNYFFWAPVHLPDGAKITSVVVFYTDESATYNVSVTLFKKNLYTGSFTMMAHWISSSDSPSYQNHKISPITGGNTVNNGGYAYVLRCYFTSADAGYDVKLHKVKILFQ
jgi:hypothetical protein